jgi:histidinol-phosphatase
VSSGASPTRWPPADDVAVWVRLAAVSPHTADLSLALRLADAADAVTLRHFTGGAVDHELKPDGSPVSAADLAVERRISEILAAERPGDGVLGEEVGASGPPARRWILDGIDGTVLFVAGRRGWATQIALEVDGEVVLGVTSGPADGRRWWASRGGGAWHRRTADGAGAEAGAERLAVSGADLPGGRYTAIPPREALDPARARMVDALGAAADPGGLYVPPAEHGALLVADGRAEACLQAGGGPWDFAALAVIVEEAGGRFSDLAGRHDIYGGGPVLFSNGRAHRPALAALSR